MPRKDGTGPIGTREVNGRGLGVCTGTNAVKSDDRLGDKIGIACGYRRGFRRGFRRCFSVNQRVTKTQKELLHEQKELLESRLATINKQLEDL